MKTFKLTAYATRLNTILEKSMPFLPPVGVTLGFIFSDTVRGIRPAIPWLFALMTLSGALKIRAKEIGAVAARPAPVVAFLLGSHLVMPLIALGLSRLAFPGKEDLVSGFVLLFSTPTAVSGFIWVSMFGGDGALALAVILLDSLIAPFAVPATVSAILGKSVSIDSAGIMASLFAMVVAPTVLGVGLNEVSRGRIPLRVGPFLGPLSKICLIFVIGGNAAAVAPQVDFTSPIVYIVSGLCILLAVLGFTLGWIFGFFPGMSRDVRTSLTFNIGFRNTNAASTVAIAFFPEAAALPATLGVIFQQSLAAIMGKILIGSSERRNRNERTAASGASRTS